jgi:hypothetical protein
VKTFLLSLLLSTIIPVYALVEPPGKHFSLEKILPLGVGNRFTAEELPDGTRNPKLVHRLKGLETYRLEIIHQTYYFIGFLKVKDEIIVNNYFRLPPYFLHDVFLQSLQTKFNKQQRYLKLEETAYYWWEDEKIKRIYGGACTITCFPEFYSEELRSYYTEDQKEKPFLDEFQAGLRTK